MAERMICAVDGCGNPKRSAGYCSKHYQRVLKYGDPSKVKKLAMMESSSCLIPGCGRKAHAKGYCGGHYSRLRRHGDPKSGGATKARQMGRKCVASECGAEAKTKGYCGKHYQRLIKYGSPDVCRNPVGIHGDTCSVSGCKERHHAHGYCAAHGYRWRTHGDPLGGGPSPAPQGALVKWIEQHKDHHGDECLHPPVGRSGSGYSQVRIGGHPIGAHVYMCELANGKANDSRLVARHLCGNGHLGCLNPRHLAWGTQAQNNDDKWGHGTMPHGEGQHKAVLTREDVVEIRALRGKMTQTEIARMFGIKQPTVSAIQLRKSWKWLA